MVMGPTLFLIIHNSTGRILIPLLLQTSIERPKAGRLDPLYNLKQAKKDVGRPRILPKMIVIHTCIHLCIYIICVYIYKDLFI